MIEYETTEEDRVDRLMDEWLRITEGKRTAHHATTGKDRDKPSHFMQIVEFPSYEEAMRNSDLPETRHLAEELREACVEAPRFVNLEVTRDEVVDENAMESLMGKVLTDLGAVAIAPLMVIGERLGIFTAMADGAPVSSIELAARTGTQERNVREWLAAMAASGYVTLDPDGRFRLSPEQTVVFTQQDSPYYAPSGFQLFSACAAHETRDKLEQAFVKGGGMGWEQHIPELFPSVGRFFRNGYAAFLVDMWLPSLNGVVDRLNNGGSVADVGCGIGWSTMQMARAFPKAHCVGFDYHAPSIDQAKAAAEQSGLAARVDFRTAGSADFGGGPYDLITFFDCLHDMGDPVGALSHCRARLTDGGVVMLVEPNAADDLAENLHPLSRAMYAASSMVCVPASQAQEVGRALGAQAGEERTREVAAEAGFAHFRRASETPFNLIYELMS
ncbi:methyltransferase domain-containing protein [Streptacidiphilus rugosus]|uniref:methyltransferase domain-containing protein n=1 Tax=Streptacidiphilus rugosus TaxID=405783 RepID=UPI000AFE83F7|nr:methyltransferase domain-containing protein [Streptacidiphilus rugosus]